MRHYESFLDQTNLRRNKVATPKSLSTHIKAFPAAEGPTKDLSMEKALFLCAGAFTKSGKDSSCGQAFPVKLLPHPKIPFFHVTNI